MLVKNVSKRSICSRRSKAIVGGSEDRKNSIFGPEAEKAKDRTEIIKGSRENA
jgi:hypothetical protein